MKMGFSRTPHKYISKKWVGRRWVYEYPEDKKMKMRRKKPEKPKVVSFYEDGRAKYFKTEMEKELFLRKQKERELVGRTHAQMQRALLKKKPKLEMNILRERARAEKLNKEASDLLMKDWKYFSDTAGKYYSKRMRGGWDASQFGYDVDDLKNDLFITLHACAKSYLSRSAKKKISVPFKSYVLGFLHSHLTGKLAFGSGVGNHMKASYKDLFYLSFFKETLEEYRSEHRGKTPSDLEMVNMLEKKRKSLKEGRGNETVKAYQWTLQKVQNKKALVKQMIYLDKLVDVGRGQRAILMDLINSEVLDIPGHYKIDPWQESAKAIVRDGVKDSVRRVIRDKVDREILIRRYGLFVNEEDPPEIRDYAPGWKIEEVVDWLNKEGPFRTKRRKITAEEVEQRIEKVFKKLKEDKKFKREMEGFVKSDAEKEWPEEGLIVVWATLWDITKDALNIYEEGLPLSVERTPLVGLALQNLEP